VFVCDLTGVELIALKRRLLEEMSLKEDSVGVFDLGEPQGRGLTCIEFMGVRRELPRGDAAVW
jgi:CRISPR/Cas system-associated endoribonuclease Cas2